VRSLYVIIGNPVAHSRSPRIHARAFELLGVDAVYAPCAVTDLEVAFRGLRALGVAGCNVTVPYKEAAALLCASLSVSARRIGAVNCIDRDFRGHNTDVVGLARALETCNLQVACPIVFGAGGAARAAVFALPGCKIINRTPERAQKLGPLGSLEDLRESRLVANCTTVGLHDDAMPFDVSLLRPDAVVVDLVYSGATGETALVKAARARGLRAIDGVEVLVQQAIASLEIWLGRSDLRELYAPLREAALG
jgi:shikimate dehydrogenase